MNSKVQGVYHCLEVNIKTEVIPVLQMKFRHINIFNFKILKLNFTAELLGFDFKTEIDLFQNISSISFRAGLQEKEGVLDLKLKTNHILK